MSRPRSSSADPADLADVWRRYLDELLVPSARDAWRVVDEALEHGVAPGRIYLEVLTPAMVEIGRLRGHAAGRDRRAGARARPDIVALSTSLSFNMLEAVRVFAALRRLDPAPLLVAGGRAYEGQADRALMNGADVFAADPETLVGELALRLH